MKSRAGALDKVAALRPKQVKVPDDAFTIQEYMRKFSLPKTTAHRELESLLEAGALKTAIVRGNKHLERKYW